MPKSTLTSNNEKKNCSRETNKNQKENEKKLNKINCLLGVAINILYRCVLLESVVNKINFCGNFRKWKIYA